MQFQDLKLSLIVAGCKTKDDNIFGIGHNGSIPWNISKDMIHFRNTTTGHFVLMGMTTWRSIGTPLTNRLNIIVTSEHEQHNKTKYDLYEKPVSGFHNITGFESGNQQYCYIMFVESLEKAFELYLNMHMKKNYELADLFVIGGGKIYQQVLEKYTANIEKIFLTKIDQEFKYDTEINLKLLVEKKFKKIFEANLLETKNNVKFMILIYLIN